MHAIRVLVVDDSALMREMIGDAIRDASGMELVGAAADGQKALEMLDRVQPDVVTLDVQMPRMGGLETLEAILARRPLPVIMVSSLTQVGASVSLDALDKGAMDYVGKPESPQAAQTVLRDELIRKIRAMAGIDVRRMLRVRTERAERVKQRVADMTAQAAAPAATLSEAGAAEFTDKCIALGISTGGPPALTTLFESLQSPLPPLVIVQHMPAQFTKPFAWRLNSISKLTVKEAETGDALRPNCAYIAPGGRHLRLEKSGRSAKITIVDSDPVSGHRPSVDVMMKDAAEIFGNRCLGIVMTGMGRDGADGCKAIRAAGGYVLGQDEDSSDVYGMNKVAYVEGGVDRQFSLDEAVGTIMLQARRLFGRSLAGAC